MSNGAWMVVARMRWSVDRRREDDGQASTTQNTAHPGAAAANSSGEALVTAPRRTKNGTPCGTSAGNARNTDSFSSGSLTSSSPTRRLVPLEPSIPQPAAIALRTQSDFGAGLTTYRRPSTVSGETGVVRSTPVDRPGTESRWIVPSGTPNRLSSLTSRLVGFSQRGRVASDIAGPPNYF